LVLMTTPNEEDLLARNVFCPSCQHTFHGMQHLTSWDKETLTEYLVGGGFTVEFCEGVDLRRWGRGDARRLLDLSLRDVIRAVRDFARKSWDALGDLLAPRPFPFGRAFRRRLPTYRPVHLVAVARAPY
jgi:hypothetical protein